MTNSNKLYSFVALIAIFFCSAVFQVRAMDFSTLLNNYDQEQNTVSLYKCSYCSLQFSSQDLQNHMSTCSQKKYYYPCGECPVELRIDDLLLHKKRLHKNDIKNSCWYCHMRIYAPEHFRGMRESHKVVESNICSVCSQNFPHAHNYSSQPAGIKSNQLASGQALLDAFQDLVASNTGSASQEVITVDDGQEADEEPEVQWQQIEREDGQMRYVCQCGKEYKTNGHWFKRHIASCRG